MTAAATMALPLPGGSALVRPPDSDVPPTVSPGRYRAVMRQHAKGVAIITAGTRTPAGFCATSLASVSLDPPLVSFTVGLRAASWPAIRTARHVMAHLLADDQEDLARRFAQPGAEKFGPPTRWHRGPHGRTAPGQSAAAPRNSSRSISSNAGWRGSAHRRTQTSSWSRAACSWPPTTPVGRPLTWTLSHDPLVATAIALGPANTRVRDYADIYALTGLHVIAHRTARKALLATAAYRGTPVQPLSDAIANLVDIRSRTYNAYRNGLGNLSQRFPESLQEVVTAVITFADPLAQDGSATTWQPTARQWLASQQLSSPT